MMLNELTWRGKKDRTDPEGPASAPLIWRAIKHATEKGQKVWSDISGLEGSWSIRYSPEQRRNPDVSTFKYFYVNIKDDGSTNWIEIIPGDDDHLELHPDGVGGWEVKADEEFDSR